MTSGGSVSAWIGQLKAGDEAALEKLHHRLWPLLVRIARKKLGAAPRRAADEEDVAQQAFWGFYRSVRAGRAPRLENRYDVLALLTHIVGCQAVNQIKHELAVRKRGAGRVLGESVLNASAAARGDGRGRGLEQVESPDITPEEEALLSDSYRHYVEALPEHVREFARQYLAGLTHREIAERMSCTERTVDRKVALILARWRRMASESIDGDAAGEESHPE